MNQLTAILSRRSLALGVPSALALGSLGQMGALGALAGLSTSASAQTAVTQNDLFLFLHKFEVYAKAAIGRSVYEIYTELKPRFPTWPTYTQAQMSGTSPTISKDAIAKCLTVVVEDTLRAGARSFIFSDHFVAKYELPAKNFTRADVEKFIGYVMGMSAGHIFDLKQHTPEQWDRIRSFMWLALFPDKFISDFTKLDQGASDEDKRRHLAGTTEDALVDTVRVDSVTGIKSTEIKLRLGDKRKPIARYDLVRQDAYFDNLLHRAPAQTYNKDDVILHGKDSVSVEPKQSIGTDIVTSTNYVVGSDQEIGLNYYVNQDVQQYGAVGLMTVEQTRRALKEAAEFMVERTSLVYESYVVATYCVRGIGQLGVAITRFALDKTVKWIDLKLLADNVSKAALESEALASYMRSDKRLISAVTVLLSTLLAGVVLNILATEKVDQIVRKNKKLTTVEQDAKEATTGIAIYANAADALTQCTALGILGLAGMPGLTTAFKQSIIKSVPWAFGAADYTAAIKDLVILIRTGWVDTHANRVKVASILVRFYTGTYGILARLSVLYGWTYVPLFPGATTRPLVATGLLAGVSSALAFYSASLI